jgi:hypothetical protein
MPRAPDGLPVVMMFDWDAHRVMRWALDGSAAQTTGTRFDHKLKKWDVQTASMEPANIDFFFAMASSQPATLADAARMYAIALDMHARKALLSTRPGVVSASAFDVGAVQMDMLLSKFRALPVKQQTRIIALQKEYVRRG